MRTPYAARDEDARDDDAIIFAQAASLKVGGGASRSRQFILSAQVMAI
jgi:hypothetical protein